MSDLSVSSAASNLLQLISAFVDKEEKASGKDASASAATSAATTACAPPPATGFTDGPDANARAAMPRTAADNAQIAADQARLETLPSYKELSPDDKDLARKMIENLDAASRGDSQGAQITRNATEQLLSGATPFRFDDLSADHTVGNFDNTKKGMITFDRATVSNACAKGDADPLAEVVAHEVTHAVNHDNGSADGGPKDLMAEYRSWLVGVRAGTGHDPSANQASQHLEQLMSAKGPYAGIGLDYQKDATDRSIMNDEMAAIRLLGWTDPHAGIENCK